MMSHLNSLKELHGKILVVVSIILSTITLTTGVIHFFIISNLNGKIQELVEERNSLRVRSSIIEKKAGKIEDEYSTLKSFEALPYGIEPNNTRLTSPQIVLSWNYLDHDSLSQDYTLEILTFIDRRAQSKRYRTSTPQQRIMYISSNKIQNGRNLWRVRPGKMNDEISFSHLWSPYYEFYFYPSLIDKLKEEKEILIGIHPIPVAFMQQVDEDGNLVGFNIDLVNWLIEKISNELSIKIKPLFKEIAWKDMFLRLSARKIDIAVGIFSASEHRESEYNLSFSQGYLTVHQVFISKKNKKDFPKSLRQAKVGAAHASINRKAAEYLEDRFNFKVVPKYTDYADLYVGIENGEVDFGIVDDLLVNQYLNSRFFQYGPALDEYLTDFYKGTLGRYHEEYAIVISGDRAENKEILEVINQILESTEGKKHIKSLKEKWINLTIESSDFIESND